MGEMLSTRQAADLMQTTRQTLHNIRKSGDLPFQVVNKRLFVYRREDIERVLSERGEQIRKRQLAQGVDVG